jgi:hypothetical protein
LIESLALARLRGAQRPARKSSAFKGGPQGIAKRRGVGRKPKANETSGLEGDARAGISPINSKPLVLDLRPKKTSRRTSDRPPTAVEHLERGPKHLALRLSGYAHGTAANAEII